MQTYELSDDSKAILLLCGVFGGKEKPGSAKPLSITEYNTIANWLISHRISPGDLLEAESFDLLQHELVSKIDVGRVKELLSRGASLAFAAEKWMNKGIWIITRSDRNYPSRYRKHLSKLGPPIIFGVGDYRLFESDGLAVVGSRNVDKEGEEFTQEVGRHCAEHGISIVSGGACGVDQFAMLSALEAYGTAIGVMADGLMRASVSGKYRDAIVDQRLLLISPYNPEAPFNIGNAMGRNKYIYAQSRFGLIISAEKGDGGTWAGAIEELKRSNHIPIFVRKEGNVPEGNSELMKHGAIPFPNRPWKESLLTLLDSIKPENTHIPNQISIFGKEQDEINSVSSHKNKENP